LQSSSSRICLWYLYTVIVVVVVRRQSGSVCLAGWLAGCLIINNNVPIV